MDESKLPKPQERVHPDPFFIKRDFFNLIESGAKTVELRIAFSRFANAKRGEVIEFKLSVDNPAVVKVRVTGVRRYKTIEEALAQEDLNKIAPGIEEEAALDLGGEIFKPLDVKKYGMVAIEFEKLEDK